METETCIKFSIEKPMTLTLVFASTEIGKKVKIDGTKYTTDSNATVSVQLAAGGSKPTVVIVPMTEGHLVQPLFPHLKHTKRFYMRPGVRVRVFW